MNPVRELAAIAGLNLESNHRRRRAPAPPSTPRSALRPDFVPVVTANTAADPRPACATRPCVRGAA
ncbi:hypothetical protein NAEX_00849 [Nannocystis exedens]|nr:hypothetical protein NAEX_00849 [Nannocystis exedens]